MSTTLALPAPSAARTRARKHASEDDAVNHSYCQFVITNAPHKARLWVIVATAIDWSTGDETEVILSTVVIALNKAQAIRRFRAADSSKSPWMQIKCIHAYKPGDPIS